VDEDEVVPPTQTLTVTRMVLRGLTRRCPLCGKGRVFETFFQKKERCPRCNFPLVREEGHWIGALGINTIVTFTLMALTLLVTVAVMWNHRRGLLIVGPTIAVGGLTPLLFFGTSQTLWSAIDLAMRPLEPDDDVDPRYLFKRKHPPTGW
jgi:uncharacterized protein (DUF983 family)